jgi:hypothetical protein
VNWAPYPRIGAGTACLDTALQRAIDSGVAMKAISKPATARLDHDTTARGAHLSYRRYVVRPRPLFAAPPADLLTLVIAEAIKRKAQAEIQREVLRDASVETPVSPERGHDHGPEIGPSDPDEDA